MKKTNKTTPKKVVTTKKENLKKKEVITTTSKPKKVNKQSKTRQIKVTGSVVKEQQISEIKKMSSDERLADINKAYDTPTHDPLSSVIADMQKKTNEQIKLKSIGLPVEKKEFALKQTLWDKIKGFFSIKK